MAPSRTRPPSSLQNLHIALHLMGTGVTPSASLHLWGYTRLVGGFPLDVTMSVRLLRFHGRTNFIQRLRLLLLHLGSTTVQVHIMVVVVFIVHVHTLPARCLFRRGVPPWPGPLGSPPGRVVSAGKALLGWLEGEISAYVEIGREKELTRRIPNNFDSATMVSQTVPSGLVILTVASVSVLAI